MNIKGFFLVFLFVIIIFKTGWSISFPQCKFFAVKPTYSYTLYSEKTNYITFEHTIELPEDVELGVWSIWKIKISFIDGVKEEYILRLWINSDGEGFLVSIKDKGYERSFLEMPKVFPLEVEVDKNINLGNNFYIVYKGEYSTIVHPRLKTKLNSVILAHLFVGSKKITVYFEKNKGPIIIETSDEVFLKK